MARKQLRIVGISNSQTQTGAFALILGEMDSNKRIPIIIGAYEAQAIALHLENMKPSRPLTHDLFVSFFEATGVVLEEVYINKFHEGIFYSLLICSQGGKRIEIDSRTSDAVALAVRLNAPIFCEEDIIKKTAIVIEETPITGAGFEDDIEEEIEDDYERMTTGELEELLNTAIEEENFELASVLRDIINKRKKE